VFAALACVPNEQDRLIASFLWPGNTADVTTLMPVVERLRGRFGVERTCIGGRFNSLQSDERAIPAEGATSAVPASPIICIMS
jgi:hypothetical protein